jgi:hypothetical protein
MYIAPQYIARSITTGKYHMTNDPNITFCNYSGQSRASRNRPATEAEIAKAHEGSFCKRCFPNGKPE